MISVVENEEKIVTPRDYTLIELRQKAQIQSRRMFWTGLLVGVALCIFVAFIMGVRLG